MLRKGICQFRIITLAKLSLKCEDKIITFKTNTNKT